jgi:hypothetical protein
MLTLIRTLTGVSRPAELPAQFGTKKIIIANQAEEIE